MLSLFVSNEASARVLAKLGMKQEGRLRQFARRGSGFEDVVVVALLREEWAGAGVQETTSGV